MLSDLGAEATLDTGLRKAHLTESGSNSPASRRADLRPKMMPTTLPTDGREAHTRRKAQALRIGRTPAPWSGDKASSGSRDAGAAANRVGVAAQHTPSVAEDSTPDASSTSSDEETTASEDEDLLARQPRGRGPGSQIRIFPHVGHRRPPSADPCFTPFPHSQFDGYFYGY